MSVGLRVKYYSEFQTAWVVEGLVTTNRPPPPTHTHTHTPHTQKTPHKHVAHDTPACHGEFGWKRHAWPFLLFLRNASLLIRRPHLLVTYYNSLCQRMANLL